MSLTFPRALPSLLIQGCDFDPERGDIASATAGGRLTTAQVAEPLWRMKMSTQCDEATFGKWRAWRNSLDGSQNLFFGQDLFRRYPLHYRTAAKLTALTRPDASPFDGTATSWSLNGDRDELTLNGLPAGLNLVDDDYVGFVWDTWRRALFQICSDAVANGSGVGTWAIRPYAGSWLPEDAVATLASPTCLMKIIPGTWSAPRNEASRMRQIAFEALQHIDLE